MAISAKWNKTSHVENVKNGSYVLERGLIRGLESMEKRLVHLMAHTEKLKELLLTLLTNSRIDKALHQDAS